MTKKRMIYLAIAFLVVIVGSVTWSFTARAAYESAEYTVVESDGDFEIRDYPDLMLASTAMKFQSQGNDGSFMRLFRYISCANTTEQKVAMTTPVFMQDAANNAEGSMGFVIPKEVAANGAPQPASDDVRIRNRQSGRFAVIRFSGRMESNGLKHTEQRLRKWISAKGLVGEDGIESAGYDPPWTPGMLRRNEVLIRLEAK